MKTRVNNMRNIKSGHNIVINPNILADILCDLIRKISNKNYLVCYGKNFIYLMEESNVSKMFFIHNVDDVIDYDGILIYKNRVNVCNTGDFEYIREFIKYMIEINDSLGYMDIDKMIDDFIDLNNNNVKTRVRRM